MNDSSLVSPVAGAICAHVRKSAFCMCGPLLDLPGSLPASLCLDASSLWRSTFMWMGSLMLHPEALGCFCNGLWQNHLLPLHYIVGYGCNVESGKGQACHSLASKMSSEFKKNRWYNEKVHKGRMHRDLIWSCLPSWLLICLCRDWWQELHFSHDWTKPNEVSLHPWASAVPGSKYSE